jgi:RNA polymerase sigma-70 factor, ECF subfamily
MTTCMLTRERHDVLMRGVIDTHGGALERYVTKLLDGDRHTAADIVQETALRAWQNVERLDVAGPDFRPWLLKVARRLVIDRHRKKQNRPVEIGGDAPEWAVRVSDRSESTLAAMVVKDALASLSKEHRDVIREVYYKGSNVDDAARTLGIPAGTVKSRTYYALRALRAAMVNQGLFSPV